MLCDCHDVLLNALHQRHSQGSSEDRILTRQVLERPSVLLDPGNIQTWAFLYISGWLAENFFTQDQNPAQAATLWDP